MQITFYYYNEINQGYYCAAFCFRFYCWPLTEIYSFGLGSVLFDWVYKCSNALQVLILATCLSLKQANKKINNIFQDIFTVFVQLLRKCVEIALPYGTHILNEIEIRF